MGSSASRETTRKRTARESWYAPLSRSTSAPIHFVVNGEADEECSLSTTLGFREDETTCVTDSRSSLASMLRQEIEREESRAQYSTEKAVCESNAYNPTARDNLGPRKRVAIERIHSRYNATLNPVAELSEGDGFVDTLNAHELVKSPTEDDRCRVSSHVGITLANCGVLEKSQSFNMVSGLDSCFAELSSPVWRRHFSSYNNQEGQELEFERPFFNEEGSLVMKQIESSSISATSPLRDFSRTPSKTPENSPLRSPLKTPTRSPLKSPWMGSSSPLFDPMLLAKFEQAVDATALLQYDCLTQSRNEGSMTTTSSSFCNDIWGRSETSSDGESPQSSFKENTLLELGVLPSWNKNVNTPCVLDKFEIRCPPKGKDKVVLYFTSLRGVRKTYEDCRLLRRILQGLGVHVDERDVWMHSTFREELTQLLDNRQLQVPRLFIKGRYIGGVEEICQLHEDGFLEDLIVGIPHYGTLRKVCEGCADMRFVPCCTCHGSCKVLDDLDQVFRCSDCNENGLMLCPLCN
ncbi:hypothetical protein L7F22_021468 [Adiantum nelumboides]|nr:hypothetical protein [Adiantum nelumboides]